MKEAIIESEKISDQYLVNLFSLLIKILNECKLFGEEKWTQSLNELYGTLFNKI